MDMFQAKHSPADEWTPDARQAVGKLNLASIKRLATRTGDPLLRSRYQDWRGPSHLFKDYNARLPANGNLCLAR